MDSVDGVAFHGKAVRFSGVSWGAVARVSIGHVHGSGDRTQTRVAHSVGVAFGHTSTGVIGIINKVIVVSVSINAKERAITTRLRT